MMTNKIQQLPNLFLPYLEKIKQTARPTIEMQLKPAKALPLWQSKIGGVPYLTKDMSYPKNPDGKSLKLLAQINFAELPANHIYPQHGILQIYIDAEDDLTGLNFDDQTDQTGFRILFHENAIEDVTQLKKYDENYHISEYEYFPVNGAYTISFKNAEQYISSMDFKFPSLMFNVNEIYEYEEHFEGGDIYEDFLEVYDEIISAHGHRLGGYPYFTQTDPRYDERFKDYILLFQLDSDSGDHDEIQIMWGDVGVGNFFIHPRDLKNKDFSKVLYNWDCH